MSQNNQQEELDKRPPRRSSLSQRAMNEGIPVNGPGNFFRTLPQDLQQRLSNNGAGGQQMGRVSGGAYNSLNPTPLNSRPPRQDPRQLANQRGTSIPRPTNSSARRTFMEPTSSSVAKSTASGGTRGGRGGQRGSARDVGKAPGGAAKIPPQPRRTIPTNRHLSVAGRDKVGPSRNTTLHSMTRTSSMDSVWSNSAHSTMFMTPSLTPALGGRPKSPGSTRRWGSAQDLHRDSHHSKTIKISSDRKVLTAMMHHVHAFLLDHRYPNLPMPASEMKKISTATYYSMVAFAVQFLVGSNCRIQDDPPTRIVELSNFLKYPSVISKSHLKSANAQHAWPSSLTFLAWLCCRVQAIEESEMTTNPMVDFMKDTFQEVALQNCLNLYFFISAQSSNQSEEEKQIGMQEKTAEELLAFRNKISEMFMSEVNFTLDELYAQKEDNMRHLKELQEKPDPVKELSVLLGEKEKKLHSARTRISEMQEQIKVFQDLNLLRMKAEGLKCEIISRRAEIDTIKEKLSSQPFNKQGEKKMLMEIQNLQDQRKCLASILHKLESDLHFRQLAVSNLNERFRQTIARFTVVESFNANLSNLRVDGLSVPVNPFTPEELKLWLEKVESIHDKTEQVSQRLIEALKGDNAKLEEMKANTKDEINLCSQENGKIRGLIEDLTTRMKQGSYEFDSEKIALELKFSEFSNAYKKHKEVAERYQKGRENHEERLAKLKAGCKAKTESLEKWYERVEDLGEKFSLLESTVLKNTQMKVMNSLKTLEDLKKARKEPNPAVSTPAPEPQSEALL